MIDDKDAIDKLNKTNKKAEETGGKLGKIAGGAAKFGAGVLSVGTMAAGAMISVAKSTADAGDRVDKLSQKIGLSRQGFQEWDYVMSQNGMSIETMQGGVKTLTNQFDDLKKGGKTATEAFGRLGLSLSDLEGMSREEMFNATFTALQGVSDETERAALANDLFGRSGAEMAPLLNQSAESVEALKKQANDLGMVMGDDAIDGAVQFTDSLDTMKRAAGGVMNKLGAALMPVLQKVVDVIIANMPMIQTLIEKITPIIASVFDKLLPPLLDLAESLFPVILDLIASILPVLGELFEGLMPVIIELINMLLPPIINITRMILPLLLSLIEPLMPLLLPLLGLLQPFIDLIMMIIEPLSEMLNLILPPLIGVIATLTKYILPPLTAAFKFVADMVGNKVKSVFEGLKPIIEGLKKYFGGLIDFITGIFTGNWSKAWGGIVKIFSGIWDTMKAVFKAPINWIIDGINTFIRGMNKIKIPDWVPMIGGKGISIGEIPRLKVGLDYVPSDDFPALLHKGERVLTAEQNKKYSNGSGGITINIANFNNTRSQDVEAFARELEFYSRKASAARGTA